ncbi:MAG: VOC family protein [Hyphomicrobiales bacterium]|nr:VOC family protein [Hyphomicrobiales bacterium]
MTDMKHLPEGMHTLNAHLVCKDEAAAIDFYKKAFGAQEVMRMPGPDGKLMHAALRIGDSTLMLVDENPQWNALGPQNLARSPVTIHMNVPDVDAVYAQAVQAGASAVMPPADMFWGDRYGALRDPFGHSWSIATRIRVMTPDQMRKAGEAFMKTMAAQTPGCNA